MKINNKKTFYAIALFGLLGMVTYTQSSYLNGISWSSWSSSISNLKKSVQTLFFSAWAEASDKVSQVSQLFARIRLTYQWIGAINSGSVKNLMLSINQLNTAFDKKEIMEKEVRTILKNVGNSQSALDLIIKNPGDGLDVMVNMQSLFLLSKVPKSSDKSAKVTHEYDKKKCVVSKYENEWDKVSCVLINELVSLKKLEAKVSSANGSYAIEWVRAIEDKNSDELLKMLNNIPAQSTLPGSQELKKLLRIIALMASDGMTALHVAYQVANGQLIRLLELIANKNDLLREVCREDYLDHLQKMTNRDGKLPKDLAVSSPITSKSCALLS